MHALHEIFVSQAPKLMAPCHPAAVGQFLDLVESTATDQPMQDALKKVGLLCGTDCLLLCK